MLFLVNQVLRMSKSISFVNILACDSCACSVVVMESVLIFLSWLSESCIPLANLLRVFDYKLLLWTEIIICLKSSQ
jgi:hypothetical protein